MIKSLLGMFKQRRSSEFTVPTARLRSEDLIRETEDYLNRHLFRRDLDWPVRHPLQEDAAAFRRKSCR